jgi:hypothetical protein
VVAPSVYLIGLTLLIASVVCIRLSRVLREQMVQLEERRDALLREVSDIGLFATNAKMRVTATGSPVRCLSQHLIDKLSEVCPVVALQVGGAENIREILGDKIISEPEFRYSLDGDIIFVRGQKLLRVVTNKEEGKSEVKFDVLDGCPVRYYILREGNKSLQICVPVKAAQKTYSEALSYRRAEGPLLSKVFAEVESKIGSVPSILLCTIGKTGPSILSMYPSLASSAILSVFVGAGLKRPDKPTTVDEEEPQIIIGVGGLEIIRTYREPTEDAGFNQIQVVKSLLLQLSRSKPVLIVATPENHDHQLATAIMLLAASHFRGGGPDELEKVLRFTNNSTHLMGIGLLLGSDPRALFQRILNNEYDYLSINTPEKFSERLYLVTCSGAAHSETSHSQDT